MSIWKNHKKAVITLVSCLIIGGGVAGTYATLTAVTGDVINSFSGEVIETHIEEDFPEQDVKPDSSLKKDVKIVNDGPSDAFIRARITISPDKAVTVDAPTEDWELAEDGWYYYKKVVSGPINGEKFSTTSLMTKVNIPADIKEDFDVTVYQEAVGTGRYTVGDVNIPLENIQKAFNNVTTND